MSNMSAMTAQIPAQIHPARASCHLACKRLSVRVGGGVKWQPSAALGGWAATFELLSCSE